MSKQYQTVMKILIAGVLGLAAVLVPVVAVKFLLSLAAVIVLSLCLKKFAWVPIVFFILFIMLPVGFFTVARINAPFMMHQNWFRNIFNYSYDWRSPGVGTWGGWSFSGTRTTNHTRLMPDKLIDAEEQLIFRGLGLEIEFVTGFSGIKLPGTMQTRRSGGTLTISMPDSWQNTTAVIQVGTGSSISSVEVQSAFLRLRGRVELERMILNCTALEMSADVTVRGNLMIRGASASVSGTYFVNCFFTEGVTALNVDAWFESESIRITGSAAANMKLELSEVKDFFVSGSAISANIKYLDKWEGVRRLTVEGMAGDVLVMIPAASNGDLDVNRSGYVRVSTTRY